MHVSVSVFFPKKCQNQKHLFMFASCWFICKITLENAKQPSFFKCLRGQRCCPTQQKIATLVQTIENITEKSSQKEYWYTSSPALAGSIFTDCQFVTAEDAGKTLVLFSMSSKQSEGCQHCSANRLSFDNREWHHLWSLLTHNHLLLDWTTFCVCSMFTKQKKVLTVKCSKHYCWRSWLWSKAWFA